MSLREEDVGFHQTEEKLFEFIKDMSSCDKYFGIQFHPAPNPPPTEAPNTFRETINQHHCTTLHKLDCEQFINIVTTARGLWYSKPVSLDRNLTWPALVAGIDRTDSVSVDRNQTRPALVADFENFPAGLRKGVPSLVTQADCDF